MIKKWITYNVFIGFSILTILCILQEFSDNGIRLTGATIIASVFIMLSLSYALIREENRFFYIVQPTLILLYIYNKLEEFFPALKNEILTIPGYVYAGILIALVGYGIRKVYTYRLEKKIEILHEISKPIQPRIQEEGSNRF